MPIEDIPEPWCSFFLELDYTAKEEVRLHCCGGFVMTRLYELKRETLYLFFQNSRPQSQPYGGDGNKRLEDVAPKRDASGLNYGLSVFDGVRKAQNGAFFEMPSQNLQADWQLSISSSLEAG